MAYRIKAKQKGPNRLDGRVWSRVKWEIVDKLTPRLERELKECRYLIIEIVKEAAKNYIKKEVMQIPAMDMVGLGRPQKKKRKRGR